MLSQALSLTHDLKLREGEVPSVGGIRGERRQTEKARRRRRKEWEGVGRRRWSRFEEEGCRQMGDRVRICVFGLGFVIFFLRLCGSQKGM